MIDHEELDRRHEKSGTRVENARRSMEAALREYVRAYVEHGDIHAAQEGFAADRAQAFGIAFREEDVHDGVTEELAWQALDIRNKTAMLTDYAIVAAVVDPNLALHIGDHTAQFVTTSSPTSTLHATLGLAAALTSHTQQQMFVEG